MNDALSIEAAARHVAFSLRDCKSQLNRFLTTMQKVAEIDWLLERGYVTKKATKPNARGWLGRGDKENDDKPPAAFITPAGKVWLANEAA